MNTLSRVPEFGFMQYCLGLLLAKNNYANIAEKRLRFHGVRPSVVYSIAGCRSLA